MKLSYKQTLITPETYNIYKDGDLIGELEATMGRLARYTGSWEDVGLSMHTKEQWKMSEEELKSMLYAIRMKYIKQQPPKDELDRREQLEPELI